MFSFFKKDSPKKKFAESAEIILFQNFLINCKDSDQFPLIKNGRPYGMDKLIKHETIDSRYVEALDPLINHSAEVFNTHLNPAANNEEKINALLTNDILLKEFVGSFEYDEFLNNFNEAIEKTIVIAEEIINGQKGVFSYTEGQDQYFFRRRQLRNIHCINDEIKSLLSQLTKTFQP